MGLSSSKSKTTNTPWAPAQPFILKGLQQSSDVFDKQQPSLNKFSGMQMDTYGRLAPGAEAGIQGAQGVVNSTLAGDNLNGNPYLDSILARTRADTTDAVNGQFEGAGRYGSGMHAKILARTIADAENQARYANYSQERQNQLGAVGQASGLMGGSQSLLNNAADLPWIGVGALNGNVRQASNGYGTTTQTQSSPWGPMLGGILGAGLSGWASGGFQQPSDRRLKTNIELIRRDPDGLGWYSWNWKANGEKAQGVIADEVEQLRPWAFLPNFVGEYAGVNYAALEGR